MMRAERPETPLVLVEHGARWTESWVARNAEGKEWSWPQYDNKKLNHHLLPDLHRATQSRCAYCDSTSAPTIDHFKPKASFASEAFAWPNLFPACTTCQGAKLEDFHVDLLKPDEDDYSFERYFDFDAVSYEIIVNLRASAADQRRAKKTLELLKLNAAAHTKARRIHLKLSAELAKRPDLAPDEWPPYRFLGL